MNMLGQSARPHVLVLLLSLLSGCVTGRIQPVHFQFVTVVEKALPGPDGWRAACVHAKIRNGTTGDFFFCKFGVEVPIENIDGPVSIPLAQRIAADCANEAALSVLGVATREPDPPLGILCEQFKTAYGVPLNAAIGGARVTRVCDKKTKPVIFGEFSP
ncbi:hypothetical protein [Archangium lansingense]|uniref:Lipoprotein n=1 Tax=Archangium lansingense TaxID=2995310 RepID=A0ABT4A6J4_9BACT|nr:hypothetical protein [Archangium lansinium]MCY1076864.1 hypothetical protein [Archangium lansinium]